MRFLMYMVLVPVVLMMMISGCSESVLNPDSEFDRGNQQPFGEVTKDAHDFSTLLKSEFSNDEYEERMIVHSEPELQALYEKIYAPGTRVNIPAIDFTRSMVIGCFMGMQSSGGHAVEITSVSATEDSLYVDVLYMVPAPGQPVTTVMTQPVHVITTERSELPVVFTVTRKQGTSFKKLDFRSLLRGETSEISRKRQLVIRDETTLSKILSDMGEDALRLPFLDEAGIEEIDFNREMVVAVFRGEALSTPRYIQVESIWEENKELKVYVVNLNDPREILKKSSPFHLVITEKSDNPVSFIESERNLQTVPGDGTVKTVFMSLTQEGGIAGFNRTLTIYTDWTAELIDKSGRTSAKGYLSRTDIRNLRDLIAAKDIFAYEDQYGEPGAVTDQMTRTIYFASAAGEKSIAILDDTGNTPPEELLRLEQYLNTILGNILKQNTN